MTIFVASYWPVGAQPSFAGARTASGAFADSPFGGSDHANASSRNIRALMITSLVPDTESNTRNGLC